MNAMKKEKRKKHIVHMLWNWVKILLSKSVVYLCYM